MNKRTFTFHFYCQSEEKYESANFSGVTFAEAVSGAHEHRHSLWTKSGTDWKVIAMSDNTFWDAKMDEIKSLASNINTDIDIPKGMNIDIKV